MCPIRARASYGQHFLSNKKLAEKIVMAAEPTLTDNFIEIGPGKGALTGNLVKVAGFVLAFELDKRLGALLRETYQNHDNIAIMISDFLDFKPDDLSSKVKIIGNIPYNITTPILEKLLEFHDRLDLVVLTMQKEVADKLTALPGSSNYGKLTLQIWSQFQSEQLFSVPRKAFSPPPTVASRVVKLIPIDRGIGDLRRFSEFIAGCFSQKNRTLINSFQIGFDCPKEMCEYLLRKAELDMKVRPRDVTFDQYLKLYRIWQENR
jgi:16S rRNA (adenine1518-N6/adenine1519-N6)-dimethyltransferase